MMRCAGGGPDLIERAQTRITKRTDRVEMPHGRNPSDGEAGLRANKRRVSLTECFPGHLTGFCIIDTVAASREKQDRLIAVQSPKNDRFSDLIKMTSGHIRRLLRGAGISPGLHDRGVYSGGL